MFKQILLVLFTARVFAQTSPVYRANEQLEYEVHYGFMYAGAAKISLVDSKTFNGIGAYHIVGIAESNKTFDLFFKMRDRYETYVDKSTLSPVFFYRSVNEDGYKFIETQIFNQEKSTVTCNSKTYSTARGIQDMFSIFYYARVMCDSVSKSGDTFSISYFMTDKSYRMRIVYMGLEVIETDLGKFNCMKFHPMVEKGRVFKNEEDVIIWVTSDSRHIPIRIQANLLIGSVKCDLARFK